mmetsp:Transcript_118048/g.264056  ORF Transcript_118048/g.264056 Transcript_118048/m.264056 type:complete len:121 (-) Transcript_118048:671-1033(-)
MESSLRLLAASHHRHRAKGQLLESAMLRDIGAEPGRPQPPPTETAQARHALVEPQLQCRRSRCQMPSAAVQPLSLHSLHVPRSAYAADPNQLRQSPPAFAAAHIPSRCSFGHRPQATHSG